MEKFPQVPQGVSRDLDAERVAIARAMEERLAARHGGDSELQQHRGCDFGAMVGPRRSSLRVSRLASTTPAPKVQIGKPRVASIRVDPRY